MKDILENAVRIARLAGAKIKEIREENSFTEQLKYGVELLTSADIASNDLILEQLTQVYPSHRIISEESPNDGFDIDEPTWIIDPIDGTVSYANGHYQCCISIAFAQNGRVQVGVVYNPFLEELFHAVAGEGAFLNNTLIKVKPVSNVRECLVATGFPYQKDNIPAITAYLTRLLPHIRDVRRMGSAALDYCWVACGRLQAYYESSLAPWDMAAGRLIALEAGATVGHYDMGQVNSELAEDINGQHILVSSPGVYDELSRILAAD